MSQIENSIESGGRRESENRFRRFDGPLDLFLKWFAALGCFFFLLNISGVFAWLIKRISDTASSMSHYWFPEETNEQD